MLARETPTWWWEISRQKKTVSQSLASCGLLFKGQRRVHFAHSNSCLMSSILLKPYRSSTSNTKAPSIFVASLLAQDQFHHVSEASSSHRHKTRQTYGSVSDTSRCSDALLIVISTPTKLDLHSCYRSPDIVPGIMVRQSHEALLHMQLPSRLPEELLLCHSTYLTITCQLAHGLIVVDIPTAKRVLLSLLVLYGYLSNSTGALLVSFP